MMVSCCGEADITDRQVKVSLQLSGPQTRQSGDMVIEDLSLIVFSEEGLAERCILMDDGTTDLDLSLIAGRSYSFFAFANFGYHVFADHISEMWELSYHLNDPEVLAVRMPLCGSTEDVTITEDNEICIMMERLGTEVDVRMDRSRLSEDVRMKISAVRICNSPNSVMAFSPSRVEEGAGCLDEGYCLADDEVEALNTEDSKGMSGEVCLFLLENMQGRIEATGDSDKTFEEDDPKRTVCTYMEMDIEYLSHTHFSSGGPLVYRTYLGEDFQSLDVERGNRYRITIRPEGDGLTEEGWRVDKTFLHEFGPSRFASFPESYIQGNIGDTLHLWCEFYPPHAQFDIGLEELEYDKAQGIYDYIMDEDGHGVRLILKNPGTGLVYMEAGPPVNEAALWVVEVNLPFEAGLSKDTLQYGSGCTTSIARECLQRQDFHLPHQPPDRDRSPSQPSG